MKSDEGNNPKDGGGDLPRFLESKPLRAKQATPAQKKQWVILSILILFLVVLVIQTLAGGKKKRPPPLIEQAAVPVAVAAADAALTPENDIFNVPSHDKTGRPSPFTRIPSKPGVLVQGPAALVLQGVLSDSSGSTYAVVNEKIVKKGERMADKVVTTIQSDSVTLRSDSGEEVTLRMKT